MPFYIFVGLLLKQAEPVTIPLLCPSRCFIMGELLIDAILILPLCLFTHPPSRDVWQGFLRQFCPTTYYLVATHIDLENGARLELLLLSTDVL